MGIDKRKLTSELASLDKQESLTLEQLAQIHGAQRLARHLLGTLERQEDEEAEKVRKAAEVTPEGA